MLRLLLLACALLTPAAQAQWQIQQSNTAASLRGIHSLGNGIVWASGTEGTILRTTDQGQHWQPCATPPAAEHLDFRGIQAFDAQTAIVMSSGKGDLSRLYKTTDACQTWKLLLTNPYSPDGFFDALLFIDSNNGILLGDPSPLSLKTPVESADNFRIRVTFDGGKTWGPVSAPDTRPPGSGLHALQNESAFAASNSSMTVSESMFWLATSASRIASRRLYERSIQPRFLFQSPGCAGMADPLSGECGQPWTNFQDALAPIQHANPSSGVFSLFFRDQQQGVAVGGDYLKPNDPTRTAAFTPDDGLTWTAATTPPHGYRSSVAYSPTQKAWITVGPNGTDRSTDDGRNWHPLKPQPGEALDADRNWNALSLPFVVGPHGRIGLLNPTALNP